MQTVLMNFGDNKRVISDVNNAPIQIDIGQMLEADVHPVHLGMIQRSLRSETLIVVDEDTLKYATQRFVDILWVLKHIDDEDYDTVLNRFNAINGPNPDSLRPTREMVRIACRELARKEVREMMDKRAREETEAAMAGNNRVTIREQGDPVTRAEIVPPGADKPNRSETDQKEPKKPKKALRRERL